MEPFKRFIEQGDELQAWQTVLGNLRWIKKNGIQVPENLEELAQNQGKRWNENGQIYRIEFYQDGKLHGNCKVFNDDGTLWIRELYEHGKLIESF